MANKELNNSKESFVTFMMNEERYAISVFKVTELLEMMPVTKVPRVPEFMRGVINLRGEVIPVIDSRIKFSFPEVADTINTCIIVMQVQIQNRDAKVGIIVDSISEVIEIDKKEILPLPSLNNHKKSDSVTGVIKENDQITMVLDVDAEFKKDVTELDKMELQEEEVLG
ncbi:MAG: chemotaxis protein CheW [Bacteroidota bacterium]